MSEAKFTEGPWISEGFEQIAGNGQFYGGLILGADGETIVAQCVMPHNEPVVRAAPELLQMLKVLSSKRHMFKPIEFGGYRCSICDGSPHDSKHFRVGEDARTDMQKASALVDKVLGGSS